MTLASPCMVHSRCRGKVAWNATKSHYAQEQPSAEAGQTGKAIDIGGSGGGERKFGMGIWFRAGLAVRTSGTAGLGAGTERLVNNGLDGARASAAFGAATEAAIDLLGIARKLFSRTDGVADIVVAEDVAGTNNHENGKTLR